MPYERRVDHPIILGIVGDSAAGKTTLTAGIAAILGADRVATICTDDYHRYGREDRARLGITPLHPECNYIDIMEQHLALLRQGKPILKPVYDHKDGSLAAPEYVAPRPYIIVEGLLGYHSRAMRACYDVKVYLDPDESLRVRWKVQRDCAKRGYAREQVLKQIQDREADTPRLHPPAAHLRRHRGQLPPARGPCRGDRCCPQRAPPAAPDPAPPRPGADPGPRGEVGPASRRSRATPTASPSTSWRSQATSPAPVPSAWRTCSGP